MIYEVTNEVTGETFRVEDDCIFEIHDLVAKGIKERGWKEEKTSARRATGNELSKTTDPKEFAEVLNKNPKMRVLFREAADEVKNDPAAGMSALFGGI